MGSGIEPAMRAALLACAKSSDREFREIAAEHGVDREALQEHWFEQEYGSRARVSTFSPEILRHDAHHHFA